MKLKLCIMALLTFGIVVALVLFFEQNGSRTADTFDGVFVYHQSMMKKLL